MQEQHQTQAQQHTAREYGMGSSLSPQEWTTLGNGGHDLLSPAK